MTVEQLLLNSARKNITTCQVDVVRDIIKQLDTQRAADQLREQRRRASQRELRESFQ